VLSSGALFGFQQRRAPEQGLLANLATSEFGHIRPGQFLAPHGLAVDSRGHLYVVDEYNHRIQKFDVGEQ
jgi:hypothetical protein